MSLQCIKGISVILKPVVSPTDHSSTIFVIILFFGHR